MFLCLRVSYCLARMDMELPSGESLCCSIGNVLFFFYPSLFTTSANKCSLQKWRSRVRHFLINVLLATVLLVTAALSSHYIVVVLSTLAPIARRWHRIVTSRPAASFRALRSVQCVAVCTDAWHGAPQSTRVPTSARKHILSFLVTPSCPLFVSTSIVDEISWNNGSSNIGSSNSEK